MNTIKLLLLVVPLAVSSMVSAEPAGNSFTYQGELRQLGAPANGAFDFQFELFDVSTDGNPITTTVQLEDVDVTEGVFTVNLDFGSGAIDGSQLWLEIGVRDGLSEGGFTKLMPRQLLTATPYAVKALSVADNSITADQIDPASVQKRVYGSCAVGSKIRAINTDGSVVCELDIDTDTTLSEAQVDDFVANNNYSTGPHTVDTTLSEDDVDAIVTNSYVHKTGDTMSGSLNVDGALSVSGLISVGDNVSASGEIESTTGGFRFPDGTIQESAAASVSIPEYYFIGPSKQQSGHDLLRPYYDNVCQTDYANPLARMCTSVEVMREPYGPAFSQVVRVEPLYGDLLITNNGTSFRYVDATGFMPNPTSSPEMPNCYDWSYSDLVAPTTSFLVVDKNKTIVERMCDSVPPGLAIHTACCVPRQ